MLVPHKLSIRERPTIERCTSRKNKQKRKQTQQKKIRDVTWLKKRKNNASNNRQSKQKIMCSELSYSDPILKGSLFQFS